MTTNRLKTSILIIISVFFTIRVHTYGQKFETAQDFVNQTWQNGRMETLKQENEANISVLKSENGLPGPEIGFEHYWVHSDHTKWTLGVTQSFDWPGLYGINKKKIQQEELAATYRQEALRQQLRLETLILLARISYAQQRIDVCSRHIETFGELKKHLDEALDRGVITILDQRKAAIEEATLTLSLQNFTKDRDAYITELEILTGQTFGGMDIDWIAFRPQNRLLEYETYLIQSKNSPELLELFSRSEAANLNIRSADMSNLPGFSIGYRHETEQEIHYNGFSVGLTLPHWNFSARRQAARKQAISAATSYETARLQNENRIKAEYKSALALKESLQKAHSLNAGCDYLDLLKEAYNGGQLTMLDFLREQIFFIEATAQITDLEEQYALLLISLNRYANE